ncbi:pentatricopeptide repeat-containing protein At3g12770-like [Aristolochia californica]|uniref:pentatricopeptide repeat-containing protein At3g12770-like n=1 Tax=Aristolochia californica TaxID=171875 RepID=UPI0035D6BECB
MLASYVGIYSPLKTIRNTLSRYCTSAAVSRPSVHVIHLLQLATEFQSLRFVRQSHAVIFSLGLQHDTFCGTKLIYAYSTCRFPFEAQTVFSTIPRKNVFVWNSLVSGYAKNHIFEEPLTLFGQMHREGISDNYTFATVSKVAAEIGSLESGKSIHCIIIKTGFGSDTVVLNSVVAMYCKCNKLCDAHSLFEEMTHKTVGSWNVLISEYADRGDSLSSQKAYNLVKQMCDYGVKPDAHTVASVLPICTNKNGIRGRELHGFIIKNDLIYGSDLHVGSCLVNMYAKSHNIFLARHVFDLLKYKNIILWTVMIAGYIQNTNFAEALTLFRKMQVRDGIMPNRVCLITVLPACVTLANLIQGREIHAFAIRSHFIYDVSLRNALIDMYCKCGSLKCARYTFDDDSCIKDVISWSSMIAGYGLHGKPEEAILLFYKMCELGMHPDYITSVGVLSACCRGGLVDKSMEIYNLLVADYGIVPTVEICSCMVNILGHTGRLEHALDFIYTMPVNPGPSVWGALLNASVIHGNLDMQDLAYKSLLELEPENPSNYISLSNTHASSGRWDVVAKTRSQMKVRGLRKLPGCSWINFNGKVHSFYVADKSHPCLEPIYATLDNLVLMMKGVSVPDFEYLP